MIPPEEFQRLVLIQLNGLKRTQEPDVWIRSDIIEQASDLSVVISEGDGFTQILPDDNKRKTLKNAARRRGIRQGQALMKIDRETAIEILLEWVARNPLPQKGP